MYVDEPNQAIEAANGVRYAYRRCGPSGAPSLVLLSHFRGTLDSWDTALVDALAVEHDVIAFDSAGVGLSTGRACRTVRDLAADTLAFLEALDVRRPDLLGAHSSEFSFVMKGAFTSCRSSASISSRHKMITCRSAWVGSGCVNSRP